MKTARLRELSAHLGLTAEVVARAYERVPYVPPRRQPVTAPARRGVRGRFEQGVAQPSADLGPEPMLAWLPLTCLTVDERYQRPLTNDGWDRINRIVREFRWSRFQPLTVTGRDADAGTFAVIDGQHRLEAARRHPAIDKVPCYVIAASEVADQALSFVAVNRDRAGVRPVNVFWAELAAGDELAVRIQEICGAAGVAIGRTAKANLPPKTTTAIGALRTAAQIDAAAATIALKALAQAHPDRRSVFRSHTIVALTEFVADMGADLDQARLVRGLASLQLDAAIDEARAQRRSVGGTLETALRSIIGRAYSAPPLKPVSAPAQPVVGNRNERREQQEPRPAAKRLRSGGKRQRQEPVLPPDEERRRRDMVDAAVKDGRVTKVPSAGHSGWKPSWME